MLLRISWLEQAILPKPNIRFRKVAEFFGNSATFLVHPWTVLIIHEPVSQMLKWLVELV